MGSLLVTFGAQVRPSEVSKASWRLILIKNDDSQLFARVPSEKLNIDPQDAPRGAPDAPKTPQEAPKTPPRGFQEATFSLLNFDLVFGSIFAPFCLPKCLPLGTLFAVKIDQKIDPKSDCSKSRSKIASRAPKTAPRCPPDPPGGLQGAQNDPPGAPK